MSIVAVIIQARLNSTRLPNKVLLPVSINSKITIIEFMINRLRSKLNIPIIVAIPDNTKNDKLANFLSLNKIDYYRGSENDVLSRYLVGAQKHNLSSIIRLTSDCPLVDPELINEMLSYFKFLKLDYLGNTTPPNKSTFPDGSDIEIFSTLALKKANMEIQDTKYREHVTFQFWDNKFDYNIKRYDQKVCHSHLRYTIDNPEDYQLFKIIYDKLLKVSNKFITFHEIQNFLQHNKELKNINSKYKPGDNW